MKTKTKTCTCNFSLGLSAEGRLVRLLHHPTTAWVVLFCSLGLTLLGWYISHHYVQQRVADRFYYETEDIKNAISKRMQAYEQVLAGGRGLFAASDDVARQEWQQYVAALQLDNHLPGVQALAFSLRIPAADKEAHLQKVRAEGFPHYSIQPATPREEYHSIVYVEPFTGRNLRAFGFDMFTEPVRRAAMEQARDTGQAAVSGRVTLVQETAQEVQAGFLMYLPVYRPGQSQDTVEQRRAALLGFVYSPFRTRDFMNGILGASPQDLDFTLFDDVAARSESLLYSTDPEWSGHASAPPADFRRTTEIKLGGRIWHVVFQARPNFFSAVDANQPLFVGLVGLLLDLLLFYLIRSIAARKKRAVALAQQMTAELNENRERLELALKGADLDFWDWNLQTGAVVFDERWATRLGYQLDEIAPHFSTWNKLIHPEDMPRVRAVIAAHWKGELPLYETEHRLRTKSGEWIWVLARGRVLERSDNGKPLRMAGTRFDITERKQFEQKLQASEEKFAKIFHSSPNAIAVQRLSDLTYLEVNDRWLQMTGFTRAEVIGKDVAAVERWVSEEMRAAAHAALLNHQVFHDLEVTLRHQQSGAEISGLVSTELIWMDGELCVLGVIQDITDWKHQEAQLRDSQLRLSGLINSAMDAIISINAQQRVILFNRAAEQMFGFSSLEMLGQPITKLLPASFRDTHRQHIRNFGDDGTTSRQMGALGTISGVRRNGEEFPIEASISQVKIGDEQIYTVILRDISQRLELEHMKREFISTVSHELRTPLTSIRGSLGLLTLGAMGELPESAKKMLAIAERNSTNLIALINDILDLERLDQGQMEIQRAEVFLQAVIQRAVESVLAFAQENNVTIAALPTTTRIIGDEDRLRQVLINLLSNAIKFSPPQSSVQICVQERGAEIEVQVVDHGRGIPLEAQVSIFDRFQQVETADNRVKGGAGLGLAICKGIIEQHDGRLGVISERGQGSTFWFRLPAFPQRAETDAEAAKSGTTKGLAYSQ